MQTSKILVSLVALFAVFASVFLAASASAFADITDVSINGFQHYDGSRVSAFAGETIPVSVTFRADSGIGYAKDVRVVARLLGSSGVSASTERFDVLEDNVYSRTLHIELPFDIDPSEDYTLEITVENGQDGVADSVGILLEVQRDSYLVQILSVEAPQEVVAGDILALDVILKNRGRQLAEDTFVEAEIPELGIISKVYFGDLSATDQSNPDKEDAVERRVFLNIPSTARTGVYDVQLTAYNGDSISSTVKRVVITPAAGSMVVSSVNSQRFAPGQESTYSMTIVNAGNTIQVYELVLDKDEGISVQLSESVVVVPAGSSKVIHLTASASEEGDYSFNVNVHSNGNLVQTESFMAKVEGSAATVSNAAVILTIVLAIIFVVLVVVLIVLLTRKPQKSNEDFGESYY